MGRLRYREIPAAERDAERLMEDGFRGEYLNRGTQEAFDEGMVSGAYCQDITGAACYSGGVISSSTAADSLIEVSAVRQR